MKMSVSKTENVTLVTSTAFTSELPSNSSIEVSNDLFLDVSCSVDNSSVSENASKANPDTTTTLQKGQSQSSNPGSKSEELNALNLKIEEPESDNFAIIGQPLAMSSPSSCFNPKDATSLATSADCLSAVHALKNGPSVGLQVPCKRNTDQVSSAEDEVPDSNASITNWSMTSLEAIESCFQQKISRASPPSVALEPLLLPATSSASLEQPSHPTKFSRISNLPLGEEERGGNGGVKGSTTSEGANSSENPVTASSLQASSCSPTTTSSTSEDTDSGVGCSNDEMMGDPTEDSPTDEKESRVCDNGDMNNMSGTSSIVESNFGCNKAANNRRRCIKFGSVTVYYFSRAQGFTCVPAQGGSTLGMSPQHVSREQYSFSDYRKMRHSKKRQLLKSRRAKNFKRLNFSPPSPRPTTPDSSSNDADCSSTSMVDLASSSSTSPMPSPSSTLPQSSSQSQEAVQSNCGNKITEQLSPEFTVPNTEAANEVNFESTTVEELDDSFSLEVVPLKKRRKILKECGVDQIDLTEHKECEWIRASREDCGCSCRVVCDPRTCLCSLNGIKCQVDRQSYPCGCTKQGCGNQSGRIEFNLYRVRTHFFYTLLRLQQHRQKMNSLGQNSCLFGMTASSDSGVSGASGSDTEDAADDYSLKTIDDNESYSDCQNGLTNITGEKGECANYCCLGVASRTTTYPDESHSKMMQQYYCSSNIVGGVHGLTTGSSTAVSLTGPSYVSNLNVINNGCNSFDHSPFQNGSFGPSDGSMTSLSCSNAMEANDHSNLFASQSHASYSEEELIENDICEEDDEESDEASNLGEDDCQKNAANFASERTESDEELGTEDSDYFVETEEEVNIIDSPEESSVSHCKLAITADSYSTHQSNYNNQSDFRNLSGFAQNSCNMYQMNSNYNNVSSNSQLHQSHHTSSTDVSFCYETDSGTQNFPTSAPSLTNQIPGTAFDVYAQSSSSSPIVSHASVSFCSNEQSNNVYVQSQNSSVNHGIYDPSHATSNVSSSDHTNNAVNFNTERSYFISMNGSQHGQTSGSASDNHWHHEAYVTHSDASFDRPYPFWSNSEGLQSEHSSSDMCEPKATSEHLNFPNYATNNIGNSKVQNYNDSSTTNEHSQDEPANISKVHPNEPSV